MGTTRTRFLIVAMMVSFFAVGMAAFLNYFKYKSTVATIVQSRVLVLGRGIESGIQASLALGIPLAEMSAVPAQLRREQSSDASIRGIDVFDHTGKVIHSTDEQRAGTEVRAEWLATAAAAKKPEWRMEEAGAYVAGIPIKNSFDLVVGHLALRYSRADVDDAAAKVGREIALKSLAVFLGVALVLPWVLFAVMRRFTSDLRAAEATLEGIDKPGWQAPTAAGEPIAAAVGAAGARLRAADAALQKLRAALDAKP